MRTTMIALTLGALLALTTTAVCQQADPLRDEQERLLTSPLYQRARAAGGNLNIVRQANPSNLYRDLPALMKASDDVLLIQVVRSGCKLAPSGEDPITMYDAQVILRYKNSSVDNAISFSTPIGAVSFDSATRAVVSCRGFMPLSDGRRYVVFLKFAIGQERQLTPARRLTGDGVQGAFELDDEDVIPSFREDGIWQAWMHSPVAKFLSEVQSLAVSQRQH